jgi:hypothetical protein
VAEKQRPPQQNCASTAKFRMQTDALRKECTRFCAIEARKASLLTVRSELQQSARKIGS